MTKILTSLFVASLLVSYGKEIKIKNSTTESQEKVTKAQSEVVQSHPAFPAEIFVETKSEGDDIVRLSATLVRPSESKTSLLGKDSGKVSFTMQDKTVYEVNPLFLEHRDGRDAWMITITHKASENGLLLKELNKNILFDGKSQIILVKDQNNLIVLRKK